MLRLLVSAYLALATLAIVFVCIHAPDAKGVEWKTVIPPSAESKFESKTYAKEGDFAPPPSWNHELPLSDQSNNGNWIVETRYSDDFNSGQVDTGKWLKYDPNSGGVDPNLLEATPDGMYFHMKKGPAVGKHSYLGSVLYSRNAFRYGYIEAEMKMPEDYSNNNIFLYAIDGKRKRTEIDIAEIYPLPAVSGRIHSMAAHVFYNDDIKDHMAYQTRFILNRSFANEYHVFGLDWSPTTIRWYLDGHQIRADVNKYWDQELHISIGCWDNNANDKLAPNKLLDAIMKVNYVRVWSHPPN